MGHLIGILAPKGGSGTTTVGLALALSLRKLHGGKVALVEGDLIWGSLATKIGLKPFRSLLDVLDKPRPWTANLVASAVDRHPVLDFDVVLAPSESHLAEKVTSKAFREFLDVLLTSHDYVVIDMARSLADRELETFERADALYLLTGATPVSVATTRKLIRVLSLLKSPMKKLGVIRNDAPAHGEATLSSREVEAGIGVPLILELPQVPPKQLDYQELRQLDPRNPVGDFFKALCPFAKDIKDALAAGRVAPGTDAALVASKPSFDPALAVAGKDLSSHPGTPGQIEVVPAPTPRRTTQGRRMTLRERLMLARGLERATGGGDPDASGSSLDLGAGGPAEAPAPPPPVPPGKVGVLVADDNPRFRQGLVRALGFEDRIHILGEAGDGVEVLERVRALRPQLVLMDANMPRKDGLSTAKQLFVDAPGTRVVMMSVQGEEAFVQECLQAGVSTFLLKPFPPDEVARVVDTLFPA